MYIKIDTNRFQISRYSNYAGENTPGAIEVDCLSPSNFHKLKTDYEDFSGEEQWAIDTSKKSVLIIQLREKINVKRSAEEDGSFEYLNKLIQCDPRSRERIMGAARKAENEKLFEVDWVCADNSEIHLTNEQIIGMREALEDFSTNVFYKYKNIKDSLQDKTTSQLIDLLEEYK